MEIKCKVRRIKSAADKELVMALKIYQKQINVCIKTDENQILQYLSRRFVSDREMAFYVLYCNDVVIGYAEIGIFHSSKVFFIDYFVLDNEYQNNAYFYICYNLVIKDLLNIKKYSTFKYIIMENYAGDNSSEIFIKKCLSLENYKVLDVPYVQPGLDFESSDSIVSCKLLIKETSQASTLEYISSSLFLNILKDIYYNHYCEWYSHFFNQSQYDVYRNSVDIQFNKIKEKLQDKVPIKNYTYINCKYFTPNHCEYSHNNQFNVPHKTNLPMLILFTIVTLILSVGVSIGLLYVLNYWDVSAQIISTITAVSTMCLTAIGTVIGIKTSRK